MISATDQLPKVDAASVALPEGFIDARRICKLLGVHDRTLRRWMSAQRFPKPALRLPGNRLRWSADQLRAFLARHTNPKEGRP